MIKELSDIFIHFFRKPAEFVTGVWQRKSLQAMLDDYRNSDAELLIAVTAILGNVATLAQYPASSVSTVGVVQYNALTNVFTLPHPYISGKLVVIQSGVTKSRGSDASFYSELDPAAGTFTINTAIDATDTVLASYIIS